PAPPQAGTEAGPAAERPAPSPPQPRPPTANGTQERHSLNPPATARRRSRESCRQSASARSALRPHEGADDPEQRQEDAEDEHHPVAFANRENPERDEQHHVEDGQAAAEGGPHQPPDRGMT